MKDYELQRRQYVIGGLAMAIVFAYVCRLAYLQLFPNDYGQTAWNNALYN